MYLPDAQNTPLRCKKTQLSKILNQISQIPLSDPLLGSSFLLILQGPEAVAAALAGCKILKEMARLESEAESARSMKEAKYEQFALGEYKNCSMTRADSVIRKSKGQTEQEIHSLTSTSQQN